MIKVYLGLDSQLTFFMWNKEVIDILDPEGIRLQTIEVPGHLYDEYCAVEEQRKVIQDKLEVYYRETIEASRRTEKT